MTVYVDGGVAVPVGTPQIVQVGKPVRPLPNIESLLVGPAGNAPQKAACEIVENKKLRIDWKMSGQADDLFLEPGHVDLLHAATPPDASGKGTIEFDAPPNRDGDTSSKVVYQLTATRKIDADHFVEVKSDVQVTVTTPWLPVHDVADYFAYVRPVRLGVIEPLINGRSSGGTGPDDDHTEPLDRMQETVASLGNGDFVYLSAWFFEPATQLTKGPVAGATTWGALFALKAKEGVTVRILINDFDPVSGLDQWLDQDSLKPLDALVSGLPAAARKNLKYFVSMHPAHVGTLKSLLATTGSKHSKTSINVASHHQKFMVARRGEELTAFCGGLDIESRKTPAKWAYVAPFMVGWHDLHVKLTGPITRDLEQEFVLRWNREQKSTRTPDRADWSGFGTLVPAPLSAKDEVGAKKQHRVQMLRTISDDAILSPYDNKRSDIQEAYGRGIATASRFIYLENQYFRSAELAKFIVDEGKVNPGLVVILVVVANAGADDGENAVTAHGNYLQFETFDAIVKGLGAARVRIFTMRDRAVHSKFVLVDDRWMCIGSANGNVRSFQLDSELNVQTFEAGLVSSFRKRLWAHNLGERAATVGAWKDSELLAKWDAIAAANLKVSPQDMAGEGILAFDYTAAPGKKHGSVPDALASLDPSPEDSRFAGPLAADETATRTA